MPSISDKFGLLVLFSEEGRTLLALVKVTKMVLMEFTAGRDYLLHVCLMTLLEKLILRVTLIATCLSLLNWNKSVNLKYVRSQYSTLIYGLIYVLD